jgi:hypothetical protein
MTQKDGEVDFSDDPTLGARTDDHGAGELARGMSGLSVSSNAYLPAVEEAFFREGVVLSDWRG